MSILPSSSSRRRYVSAASCRVKQYRSRFRTPAHYPITQPLRTRCSGLTGVHLPARASACVMTVNGGGGAPSGPRQKSPWLMCIRCTCVHKWMGYFCGIRLVVQQSMQPWGRFPQTPRHLVRVERHIDGGDPVQIRPDEGGDARGVLVRTRHGQRAPAVEVDLGFVDRGEWMYASWCRRHHHRMCACSLVGCTCGSMMSSANGPPAESRRVMAGWLDSLGVEGVVDELIRWVDRMPRRWDAHRDSEHVAAL